MVSAAVFAMMLFDGFAALSLCGAGIFSLLLLLDKLFPDTVMSFLAVYFPRLLSAGMVFWTLIDRDEAARTVAALRKCHIPERIIMICSVVLRFFPTLSEDMKGYEAYEPFDRNEMRFFIGVTEAESLSRIYRDTYRSKYCICCRALLPRLS